MKSILESSNSTCGQGEHVMKLGIEGKVAMVCGSSAGIGKACAIALSHEGAKVFINGRRREQLYEAADDISNKTGNPIECIVADATAQDGQQELLRACPSPDILVNNSAGPPTGSWETFEAQDWRKALDSTMIAPIMLIKSTIGHMKNQGWGRIINITSSSVKSSLPNLDLSNGARTGLSGVIAGLSRDVARFGITINNLLPGKIDTDRLRSYAASLNEDPAQALRSFSDQIPAGRIGTTMDVGNYCAFLASNLAGFITGQNLLVDGGEYRGF